MQQKKSLRIVMLVHNPGSNDYRVVKSAEALAKAGHKCTVLGVKKANFPAEEVINEVKYKRVKVPTGLRCILLAITPRNSWISERLKHRLAFRNKKSNSKRSSFIRLLNTGFNPIFKLITFFLKLIFILLYPFLLLLRDIVFISAGAVILTAYVQMEYIKMIISGKIFRLSIVDISKHFLGIATYSQASEKMKNKKKQWNKKLRQFAMSILEKMCSGHEYLLGRFFTAFYPHLLSMDADVYHCHEIWPLEACVYAAKTTGVKIVYDSHELEAYRNSRWSEKVRNIHKNHEKNLISNVEEVISVSPGIANILKNNYGLKKVWVVRNIPVRPQIESGGNCLRKSLALPDSTPLLVYVGGVTFNRGLEQVMEALLLLDGFHLATVGPARDDVKQELIQLAEQLNLKNRFHILPPTKPDQLVNFITSADLSVIPIQNACLSYYHCLPNKLFESMSAGLPVATSDFPDMAEIVEEWDVGKLFDEKDHKSIAECIQDVYEKRKEYYDRKKLQSIRETLCFETESQKLVTMYEDFNINK